MKNKKELVALHVTSSLEHGGTEKHLLNLLKGTSKKCKNIVLYYYGENQLKDKLDRLGVITVGIRTNEKNKRKEQRHLYVEKHGETLGLLRYRLERIPSRILGGDNE